MTNNNKNQMPRDKDGACVYVLMAIPLIIIVVKVINTLIRLG